MLGLEFTFVCAWITLKVNSALEAVGLTAAFSSALGDAGISCNVIAAYHHDHIFVPLQEAQKALEVLEHLALGGIRSSTFIRSDGHDAEHDQNHELQKARIE